VPAQPSSPIAARHRPAPPPPPPDEGWPPDAPVRAHGTAPAGPARGWSGQDAAGWRAPSPRTEPAPSWVGTGAVTAPRSTVGSTAPPANDLAAEPAADRRAREAGAADLRVQVVHRLQRMNAKHSLYAWDLRYSDPLGPHGLAFFYTEPDTRDPSRHVLRTATRLFLDDPDTNNLPYLLKRLADHVSDLRHRPGFDPRVQLADRAEPMSARAVYIGVGVSSLDTPTQTWAQAQRTAANPLEVAGRCYAYLVDTTMILLDRGGDRDLGRTRSRCTHRLHVTADPLTGGWHHDPDLAQLADPATRDSWLWLRELHTRITGGDRAH